jgi:hypothetical protein
MKTGIYKHYKGQLYLVDKVVKHSETEEELVIYQCMYEDKNSVKSWWARPKSMFLESIQIDGVWVRRFEWIEE